jgi:hypothetical protein
VELDVSPGDTVIHDVHGDSTESGRDIQRRILRQLTADAFRDGAERALTSALAADSDARQRIEMEGFNAQRRLTRRRLFGRESLEDKAV